MTEKCNSDTLIMVYTIVRHGARGPIEFLPNDPNRSYWENQEGKLTNQGKREARELGLWYRKYYDTFLPVEYNNNDLYVYSTDCDRTLMTAQCILAAMYPPSEISQWHKDINWQPIPVHLNRNKCEEYSEMLKAYTIESFPTDLCTTKSLLDMHNHFLMSKSLREEWHRYFFGEAKVTFRNIIASSDNVAIAKKLNLPYEIPPNFDFEALNSSVVELLQIGGQILPFGVDIGESILGTINSYINQRFNKENSFKMVIYSTHDVGIIALLAQLDIQLPRPQYCGSATFELHETSDGEHFIKLYFRVKYDSDIMEVPIVGDQKFCSLQQFQKLVEDKCQINRQHKN